MNRHYPIQGQLATVLRDEVWRSIESVSRTVFLPDKHGWQKPAGEVLGAVSQAVFTEIGLHIAWYRHTVVRPAAPVSGDGPGSGTFAVNVVLRGVVDVRWHEPHQAPARYAADETFIMDASVAHTFQTSEAESVMGSFTPGPAIAFADAMFLIRNWIRSREP